MLKQYCFKQILLALEFFFVAGAVHSQIVTTIAGGAGGFSDGTVSNVKFNQPGGLAIDSLGNIYVADYLNSVIRKITPSGILTTFAGNGIAGYADGNSTTAQFRNPIGVAVDFENNVYVADQQNHLIRKITPSGIVTTLAGNGIPGNINGQGTATEFFYPSGIAVDLSKNVYVTDYGSHCIRKITSSGVVSTIAGTPNSAGYLDGTGLNAKFAGPNGIAVDSNGNLYVADAFNRRIRKITSAGAVTTFAGNGVAGYLNGTGTNAEFDYLQGLAIDNQNNLFVADQNNNRVRKINPDQLVTTVNNNDSIGFVDGTILSARFNRPYGVITDKNGNLYISDVYNNSIRKVTLSDSIITIAGNGIAGYTDEIAANPELNGPNGVVADNLGNLFVADLTNNRIRKITAAGIITTLAGNGIAGFADGPGNLASFNHPSGLALDKENNIYVTEAEGHRIRKISPAGIVSTYAGNGNPGFADGIAANSQFYHPNRITVDKQGNVYVVDVYNQRIRKITVDGIVSTLAGNGIAGYVDGTGFNAEFNYPEGITIDSLGNLYLADHNNHRIRKITPAGFVSTIAGSGFPGYINGTGLNVRFNGPGGIAITKSGDFFISDENTHRIRKMTASGEVSLWAGNGIAGLVDGPGSTAEFNDPRGICVDTSGNVYVPDFYNNKIRKITPGSSSGYITIASGNWNDGAVWLGGKAPDTTANVTVLHVITISANSMCNSILIKKPNGNLTLTTGFHLDVLH